MIVIVTPTILDAGYQYLILALEVLGVPSAAAAAVGYALWRVTE